MATKQIAGSYDPIENILHLWFPAPLRLVDDRGITEFFDEVVSLWIAPCPMKPYLLVNYTNLHIAPNKAEAYAAAIRGFQALISAPSGTTSPPISPGWPWRSAT